MTAKIESSSDKSDETQTSSLTINVSDDSGDATEEVAQETLSGSAKQARRRYVWRSLWLLVGVLLLFVGYKSIRLGSALWSLYGELQTLETQVLSDLGKAPTETNQKGEEQTERNRSESGWPKVGLLNTELATVDWANVSWTELELTKLGSQVDSIGTQLELVSEHLAFFHPLLDRLSWVPTVGSTLATSPELLKGATHGAYLAADALSLAAALPQAEKDQSIPAPATILDVLSEASETLKTSSLHGDDLAIALASIDTAQLHPRLGMPLAELQPMMPLLPAFLRMLPAAPNLLGGDEVRRYLIMVQNNHELRATGGFMTALGVLVIEEGEISELTFQDIYRIDLNAPDLPPAPEPMRRYMGIHSMTLRDTNWSPDLPITARTAKSIYMQATNQPVDGIVTVDLRAAELLVDAVAPLTIEGAAEPLTGETLLDQIQEFWRSPLDTGDTLAEAGLGRWWGQRKNFIPKLTDSALAKIKSGEVDYQTLIQAGLQALDERAIQIWVDEPTVAAELAALHWDGAMQPFADADFLALIDTNMGYNKADYLIERSMTYNVTWAESEEIGADGSSGSKVGTATATIHYTHPAETNATQCDVTPRYGDTYADMASRCYFNYVRLYVPVGSTLVDAAGLLPDTLTASRGENGTQLWAGYFVLKPGAQNLVTFTYALPPEIQPDDYQILIRRQAGTKPLIVSLTVGAVSDELLINSGQIVWLVE